MFFASVRVCSRRQPCLRIPTRYYSSKLPPPPAQEAWRKQFPSSSASVRDRVSLRNPDTATKLADAFVPDGQRDRVIIEAYPGPGVLTRALLELPKERIRKIIILEDEKGYLDWIWPLAQVDPRINVVQKRGLDWDSYQVIEDMGLLDDVPKISWEDGVHPSLQFVSHIPHHVQGEQLVSQIFRCMPDCSWLFKYGRVPLSLLITDNLWQRIDAPISHKALRSKLSVIAQAVSDSNLAVHPHALQPYDDHWHPASSLKKTRSASTQLAACNIVPREDRPIAPGMLEKWDYILRRLFVVKAKPFVKAITSLCPGADALLEPLTSRAIPVEDRLDVSKPIRELSTEDWLKVVKAFDEWPFAPTELMITDAFSRDIEKD